jgi:methionyl-tRNA formyltransferase
MTALRIVFAGTPPFAAHILEALLSSPHEIVGVYTQPDRPAGRGKQLQASAVKQVALANGIPVFQPVSLRAESEQEALALLGADLMVVVAYGLILPQGILDTPRLGCINVHASLLPRWRGAAPIERALMAGDIRTGVTIMQMDKGLDTGAMLCKEEVEILHEDDRLSLELKLEAAGIRALLEALRDINHFITHAQAQDHSASTYAAKLEKSEALVEWSKDAHAIHRLIRGGVGRNPAYSEYKGERIRFLKATVLPSRGQQVAGSIISADKEGLQVACGESALNITVIQLPGKNPVSMREFMNARKDFFAKGSQFDASAVPAP